MLTAVLKNITALSGRVSAGCVKHPAWCLAALFVLSLGLKVAVWCFDPMIGRDAATYLHTTKEWAETGVMPQSWIPPMLFCLIRIGMFFGLDPEMAGVSINLLLGALITPVGCGIAYEITRNKKIALITAVFLLLHPGINALSHEVQRDVPYLFFAGMTTWTAAAGLKRKKYSLWAVSGAFAALAFMTRYETAELFPLVFAALLVCAATHLIKWKQAAFYALIFFTASGISALAFIHFSGSKNMYERYSTYYNGKYQKVEQQFAPAAPDKKAK